MFAKRSEDMGKNISELTPPPPAVISCSQKSRLSVSKLSSKMRPLHGAEFMSHVASHGYMVQPDGGPGVTLTLF